MEGRLGRNAVGVGLVGALLRYGTDGRVVRCNSRDSRTARIGSSVGSSLCGSTGASRRLIVFAPLVGLAVVLVWARVT